MFDQRKYCYNCRQNVRPLGFGAGWGIAFLIGLCFLIIPGLLIGLYRLATLGECPICNGKNFDSPRRR